MNHTALAPLRPDEICEDVVEGVDVYGPDDHSIGTVSHLAGVGEDAQVIVDVGGFLGIGAKPVALDLTQLTFRRDAIGDIRATTYLTKSELEQMPEHRH